MHEETFIGDALKKIFLDILKSDISALKINIFQRFFGYLKHLTNIDFNYGNSHFI